MAILFSKTHPASTFNAITNALNIRLAPTLRLPVVVKTAPLVHDTEYGQVVAGRETASGAEAEENVGVRP